MGERVCSAEDGWGAVVAALSGATPGDVVRLLEGTFEGGETLEVPAGVALLGAGQGGDGPATTLRFTADAPAIWLRGGAGATLRGFSIVMTAREIARRARPEDSAWEGAEDEGPVVEWGAITAERTIGTVIDALSVMTEHSPRYLNGIALHLCEGARVADCNVSTTGHNGIVLAGSEAAAIEHNTVSACRRSGIMLARSRSALDLPSSARITGNRCHDNEEAGIVLFSSVAEAIEDNDCWGSRTHGGIVLQRDPRSADAPSSARITGNRCHDNEEEGIVLFSSDAEAIEDNDCWGSRTGGGIVLARDPLSPHAPSTARITRNRCHDNKHSGIMLFSSVAEAIDDNDCWGSRTNSGIVLQRDPRRPDAPSSARITGNRCHDNEQSGIVLFSSIAEAIEDNDCWGSRTRAGILLQRDQNSSDAPSSARITGNRCHDNARAGFRLESGDVTGLSGNRAWSNGQVSLVPSPLRLRAGEARQVVEPGLAAISGEPPPGWAEAERAASPAGALADALEAQGFATPDALARFLAGPGCPGCLAAAWPGRVRKPERKGNAAGPGSGGQTTAQPWSIDPVSLAATAPRAETANPVRRYGLELSRLPDAASFRPLPPGDEAITAPLSERIVAHARRTLRGGKGRTVIVATVGLDGALPSLRRDLAAVEAARAAASVAPPGFEGLVNDLSRSPTGIDTPLVVDCAGRAEQALRGLEPELPLLEAELAESARWQRLPLLLAPAHLTAQFVLLSGILLCGVGLGMLKGYQPEWRGPLHALTDTVPEAIWHWLTDLARAAQPWDLLQIAGAALLWPVAAIVLANHRLPTRLQLRTGRRIDWVIENRWFKGLLSIWKSRRSPWQRWVKRRLFGVWSPVPVTVVAFDNPDQWSDGDTARLRELVRLRGEDQCLVLVMALRSASHLSPAALVPFLGEAGLEGIGEVELLLVDQPLILEPFPETEPRPIAPLLGLHDRDADTLRDSLIALRDDRWTIDDLLPALVMGSARSVGYALDFDPQGSPSLAEASERLARFVSDEPEAADRVTWGREDVTEIERRASKSSAVLSIEQPQPGRRRRVSISLIGRSGFRRDLADALRTAMPDDSERQDYVHRLVGGGELHHLEKARHALGDDWLPPALQRALRHLRAAVELRATRGVWHPAPHRAWMLLEAWQEVAAALRARNREPHPDVIMPLVIELNGLALNATEPVGDSPAELAAEALPIGDLLTGFLEPLTALDPDHAMDLVERRLNGEWSFLPPGVTASVRAQAQQSFTGNIPLATQLAEARSFEVFDLIIRRHGAIAERVLATGLCVAARSSKSHDNRLGLASIVSRFAEANPEIDVAGVTIGNACSPDLPALLQDARTVPVFSAETASTERYQPEELHLGPLDPIHRRIRRIIELSTADLAGGTRDT